MIAASPARALSTTTLTDGEFLDLIVLSRDAGSGALSTSEFYETRPDLGEIDLLKRFPWGQHAPDDARLWIGSAGLLSGALKTLWIGWETGDAVHALSLEDESPLAVPLRPGERPTLPPIMLSGQVLVWYAWQATEQGHTLLRHRVQAQDGKPPSHAVTTVDRADTAPLLTAALAVPGSTDARTYVASVHVEGAGLRLKTRIMTGETLDRTLESEPIPGMTPLPNQRMALLVAPAGGCALGFIALAAETGLPHLVLASQTLDPPETRVSVQALGPERAPPSGASVRFYPRWDELWFAVFTRSPEGVLRIYDRRLDEPRILRRDVPPDFDFPFLLTSSSIYEMRLDAKGAPILFNPLLQGMP